MKSAFLKIQRVSLWAIIILLTGQNFALAGKGGVPEDYQLGLQEPATQIAEQMIDFHWLLLVIITAIVIFVLGLLLWVMIRYNEKANPIPSKTSHNTAVEVVWTLVPILILLVIAVPSFRLLSDQYTYPKSDIVIKAIGNQWYWSYQYPDNGLEFDSYMLKDEELKKARDAGEKVHRLLSVDNPVVVPVNKVVYVQVTANDVLHNWTIPAFGVKMDAIPGSSKLIWFQAKETGTYYGQCSEMCGINHAFMPIEVRVVSDQTYAAWLAAMKQGEDQAKAVLLKAALEDNKAGTKKSLASLPAK